LLRARAVTVERLSSAPVPFEELVVPSGLYDMRGFATGRLRGDSGLIGSAEYRWYISAYLDATLFADVGTVAGPRFSNIDWDRWFPSFGVGFRYYRPEGAYWDARAQDGIQIAYAPEGGLRLLFSMAAF
jgi:hemolysin activation/secretion protein